VSSAIIDQPLLLNPRIAKGKGRLQGSRNQQKVDSSTKRKPSAFEIAMQEQRRVLRPRSEVVKKNDYAQRGKK
jgi:hypothetical protein